MENQLARLTSPRTSTNSASFENMLMTTRRTPSIGGYGAAATLRVVNPVGSSSARTSFFARRFSTSHVFTATTRGASNIMLGRAAIQERNAASEVAPVSGSGAIVASSAFKARALATAQAQLLPSAEFDAIRAPDIRLSRLKSPRNADYLQRVPALRQLTERISASRNVLSGVHRGTRAFLYRSSK